jgi:hypothetical protein
MDRTPFQSLTLQRYRTARGPGFSASPEPRSHRAALSLSKPVLDRRVSGARVTRYSHAPPRPSPRGELEGSTGARDDVVGEGGVLTPLYK